jgi:hypothetical protein
LVRCKGIIIYEDHQYDISSFSCRLRRRSSLTGLKGSGIYLPTLIRYESKSEFHGELFVHLTQIEIRTLQNPPEPMICGMICPVELIVYTAEMLFQKMMSSTAIIVQMKDPRFTHKRTTSKSASWAVAPCHSPSLPMHQGSAEDWPLRWLQRHFHTLLSLLCVKQHFQQ